MNNVCNNISYLNSIDQKRRFQLFNIPPVRYDNLKNNPYEKINPSTGKRFTKFDLDMRRKAEILKYSSIRMSTQTNNLTKAQKYTQAVAGSYKTRTYSQTYLKQNSINGTLICPNPMRPTTASDVPGPPIMLYEDPAVPLYNLTNDADSPTYAIIDQGPYPMVWNNSYPVDVPVTTGNATITSIYIYQPTTPLYNFNISTPVAISITGSLKTGIIVPYQESNALTISVTSMHINVNYSYSTVPQSATVSFAPSLRMDMNLSPTQRTFTATGYLGILTISNLSLPVQTGFIYDIQIGITYTAIESNLYKINCNSPNITSYIDATTATARNTNIGCTLRGTSAIPSPLPILKITGSL